MMVEHEIYVHGSNKEGWGWICSTCGLGSSWLLTRPQADAAGERHLRAVELAKATDSTGRT